MQGKKRPWMFEITYETDDSENQLGNLPLIHVPDGEDMPSFLMVWEARETGEFEPGFSGEEVPVVEWDLRQYARMDVLQTKLDPDAYDSVRTALGLKPLKEAVEGGKKISQSVRQTVAQHELAARGKKLF